MKKYIMIHSFDQYNQQLCESLKDKNTFEYSIIKYKKLMEKYQEYLSKCETETLPETKEKKIAIGKEIYDILNNDYYKRSIKLDGKFIITDYFRLDGTQSHSDFSFYSKGFRVYDFFAISNGNCNMLVNDADSDFPRGNKNFIEHVSLRDCKRILEHIKKKVDRSIKARERIAKNK
jgi:hypothetical protein